MIGSIRFGSVRFGSGVWSEKWGVNKEAPSCKISGGWDERGRGGDGVRGVVRPRHAYHVLHSS